MNHLKSKLSEKPRISKQSVKRREKNMKQNAIYTFNEIDDKSHKDNFKVRIFWFKNLFSICFTKFVIKIKKKLNVYLYKQKKTFTTVTF